MARFYGWLPDGLWMDYFTGTVYEGGRWFGWYRGIESIPVLIKAGGMLVLDGRMQGNEIDNPDTLEICVNTAGDGEFALMEDDGQGTEYEESHWCRTVLQMKTGNGILFTVLPAEGNLSVVPEERSYRIRFYGLDEGMNPAVSVDGADIRDFAAHYEKEKGILEIGLSAVSVRKQIAVKLDNARMHDNQKKVRIYNYLNQAEIAFTDKETIYDRICKMKKGGEPADVIRELQELPVREAILAPVIEILTACGNVQ